MANPLDMQRSYAIVGTGGCGKTSLAEMLLFDAGAITRMGAIEEGTTCLDYEPEEIRRRGSIQPAVASFLWTFPETGTSPEISSICSRAWTAFSLS